MSNYFYRLETLDGTVFAVTTERCLVGRFPECDVRLPLPDVSRRHAMIFRQGQDWWLIDAGSRGGTWLNRTLLSRSTRLKSGDTIGIGGVEFTFNAKHSEVEDQTGRPLLAETTILGEAEWLVTQETALLWVGADGSITGGSKEAWVWLSAFFDCREERLPASVADWLRGDLAQRIPFQCRVGDERLRISAFPMESTGQLLVLSRLGPAFAPNALKSLGLSRAESELVPWLIRGKRNDEIAAILFRAPKTVEKQVAAVLKHLGVETRTAAAWNIIERMSAHH